MSIASSFGFNASAVAFGGLIKSHNENSSRPIRGKVPSVALAPTGGRIEAFSRRFNRGGVSYNDAFTSVEGAVEDSVYTTTVQMELSDLDVFGQVTADHIEATLVSSRDTGENGGDSAFTMRAKFTNLRVEGTRVRPPLNFELFQEIPTYGRFIDFFANDENLRKFAPSFGWKIDDEGPQSPRLMIAAAKAGKPFVAIDPVRCSLMTGDVATGRLQRDGYTLVLGDGVSKVHLAEVLIKPGRRRLNMLRLELKRPIKGGRSLAGREGSTDTYDATVLSGEGNGSSTYPP